MAKKYHPVSPLSVVSEFFEKLVNNTLVDHPEKCGFIFYFQYGFWSSQSTADLLTVSFDRIGRLFNSSGVTRTVALEHAGLLHKLKPYGITGQISLVLVIDGFKRLWDVLFQSWSYIFPNDLSDDVICNITLYTDGITATTRVGF